MPSTTRAAARGRIVACVALLTLADAACSRPEAAPPLGAPSNPPTTLAAAPSSSAVSAPACEPRCATSLREERCVEDRLRPSRCAAGSICWQGACGAVEAIGADVDPSAVLALEGEGFLTAFAAVEGLSENAAAALARADVAAHPKARSLCAREAWVSLDPRAPKGAAVLEATLLSDRDRELELALGIAGRVRVHVSDGEPVELAELPGRGDARRVDERFVPVRLRRGENRLVAILASERSGLAMRLRERDGGRAEGLALLQRRASIRCEPAALVDVGASLAITPEGLRVRLRPRSVGPVPLDPAAFGEARVVVARGRQSFTTLAVPLVERPDQPTEFDAFEATIALPDRGAAEVRVEAPGRPGLRVAMPPGQAKLVARAAALVGLAPAIAADERLPAGSRDSFAHHVETVARLIAAGDPDRVFVERHLARAEALGAELARGIDAYAALRGIVHRAHRSALDGTLQPFVAFVPPSLDKRGPLPLVVSMHGRDRRHEHALRTVIGEAPDEHMTLRFAARNLPNFPDQRAILVAPWGRGDAGVQPVGLRDVLEVVDAMKAAYAVDPRRVSVTGASLGGTVSFALPLLAPSVFAAAAPLCGYPNLLDYQSVARVEHRPWEDALLEQEYLVRYAENGADLPLRVVHGGKDAPARSKVVVDRYRALGQPVTFEVHDELEHNVWDEAYEDAAMIPWLTRHAKPAAPKRARVVAGHPRHGANGWATIEALATSSSGERAELDARYEAGSVVVSTKNVHAFSLALASLVPPPPERVVVRVDGAQIDAPSAGRSWFVRSGEGGPFALADESTLVGRKRRGVSGPMADVLHGPVAIVVGTLEPAHRDANRLVAEHLATLGGSADVHYPIFEDGKVSADELRGRSVILVGGPSTNGLTRAVAGELPVRFESAAIAVGTRRFEGADVAVSFVAPAPRSLPGDEGPLAPRYVVVHAGLSPKGTLAARFLPRYLPDWVVYDVGLVTMSGGLLFESRPVRGGGFFGERWEAP